MRMNWMVASIATLLVYCVGCSAPKEASPVPVQIAFAGSASLAGEGLNRRIILKAPTSITLLLTPQVPTEVQCDPFVAGTLHYQLQQGEKNLLKGSISTRDPSIKERQGVYQLTLTASEKSHPPLAYKLAAEKSNLDLRTHFDCQPEGPRSKVVNTQLEVIPRLSADTELRELWQSLRGLKGSPKSRAEAMNQLITPDLNPLHTSSLKLRQVFYLQASGDYKKALTKALETVAFTQKHLLHTEQAKALGAAHESARWLGRWESARDYLQQAIDLDRHQKLLTRLPIELYNQAALYSRLGKRRQALATISDGILWAQRTGNRKFELGLRTLELELLQALGHHSQVIRALQNLPPGDEQADANLSNNIGWVRLLSADSALLSPQQQQPVLDQARQDFEFSLSQYIKDGNVAAEANTLANLARVHFLSGHTDLAQAALEAAQGKANESEIELGLFMKRLEGELLLNRGALDAAKEEFSQLEIRASQLKAYDYAGHAAFGRGLVEEQLGQQSAAQLSFQQALQWGEQIPANTSPVHRSALLAARAPWDAKAARINLNLGNRLEALNVLERSSYLRWHSLGSPQSQVTAQPDARLLKLDEQLDSLRNRPQTPKVQRQIKRLNSKRLSQWDQIRQQQAPQDKLIPQLTEQSLQHIAQKHMAIVRPASFSDQLLLWSYQNDTLTVTEHAVTAERLRTDMESFSRSLSAGKPKDELAKTLGKLLLGPYYTDPPKKLLIVSEGPLRQLPWYALHTSSGPLLESTALMHSPTLLLPTKASNKDLVGPLLIVVDPTSDLPGAAKEGAALKAKPLKNATLLVGPRATRDALMSSNLESGILHFAGHGISQPDAPYTSYLKLAGGEALSLMHIADLSMDDSLVFLNACDSARGDWSDLSALTLADAFLGAGARAVVASRWAVPDGQGLRISKGFYERLNQGNTPSDALHKTLLAYANDTGGGSELWASYTLLATP